VSGTVNAKTVRATLGAAKALGLDVGALAKTWGLSEALTDVDARFPHAAWLGLWQDIIARTGSESIGIDAAERLPWGHFDVLDYVVGTAQDFGTALRRMERYFALVTTGVTHVLEDHGETVHLVRRYAPDCYTRLLAPAEFSFANVVIRSRLALGTHLCPLSVRFAAPAPSNDAVYRRLFGCPVHFDVEFSALVLDKSSFSLPMLRPEPELSRILERHAEQLINQLPTESDVVGRVRHAISAALRDGEVSVALTAQKLGMSVRTLQRRLRDGGQTFDDVYDDTRKQLARRYLGDPGISIQETAHLLAFGDVRGFYRAFRRWEDCTPAEYRQKLRAPEGASGAAFP
jgi:AraC-like DNA-binding protein